MSARIFCIGRNYVEHIRELGHPEDGDCVVFMKPASCLVTAGQAIALPVGRGAVHHEAELVIRIGQTGQRISSDSAATFIDAMGLGLDLTLRDEQNRLRQAGKPWELAKAFDHAAPLGPLTPWDGAPALDDIAFECHVNGELRQRGHTAHMLFSVERIISILSQTWMLQPGDLIYTGTPAGVGPLAPGDHVKLSSDVLESAEWTTGTNDALQKIG